MASGRCKFSQEGFMAAFSISYTATTVTVRVTGLTAGDELRFFVRLNPDIGVVLVDEKHTATASSMTMSFGGLSGSTNYAVNVRLNGTWLTAKTFTTPPEAPPRPGNWYWTSTVSSGSPISISAIEWNSFCARINAFRSYRGLSNYSFTTVYSGTAISAVIVNQARTAINSISGHGTLPSAAVQGGAVTASFFNGLRDALNAVS